MHKGVLNTLLFKQPSVKPSFFNPLHNFITLPITQRLRSYFYKQPMLKHLRFFHFSFTLASTVYRFIFIVYDLGSREVAGSFCDPILQVVVVVVVALRPWVLWNASEAANDGEVLEVLLVLHSKSAETPTARSLLGNP